MDPRRRIVTQTPLTELWRDGIVLHDAYCCGHLNRHELRTLLQRGAIWFVVADVGHPLEWIELSVCYDFWKREAAHFVEDVDRIDLDEVDYAYVAKRWITPLAEPVIVLEKLH